MRGRISENRTRGGYDFTEQSLAEFSIVNVPSNPECLARTDTAAVTKWFGHDADALLELDDGDDIAIVDLAPCLESWVAARASRQRGEPFNDPARRGRGPDVVTDISPDDLRQMIARVVAATVKTETARALGRARGRVD